MAQTRQILLIGEKDYTNNTIAVKLGKSYEVDHFSYFELAGVPEIKSYDLVLYNLDFEANISIQQKIKHIKKLMPHTKLFGLHAYNSQEISQLFTSYGLDFYYDYYSLPVVLNSIDLFFGRTTPQELIDKFSTGG
jgi:hypothetical protein